MEGVSHSWQSPAKTVLGATIQMGCARWLAPLRCRGQFETEKQTDVNLAVEMLMDAVKPAGQRAEVHPLVTGDTDLIPAIRAVRAHGAEVVAVAPPARGRARASFAAASFSGSPRRVNLRGIAKVISYISRSLMLFVAKLFHPHSR